MLFMILKKMTSLEKLAMNKKILFISHHNNAELGIMKNFFVKRKIAIHIIYPLKNQKLPKNINDFLGVIVLGGAMNTDHTKEFPGLLKEIEWIKKIIKKNKPLVGICLGAQLIAKSLGAKVKNHYQNKVEIGYKKITNSSKSKKGYIIPEKVYHWHQQGVTLPKSADLLAYNSTFKIQAFSVKNKIFGFQFHPEVNMKMILSWNLKSKAMLLKTGAENKEKQLLDHKKYAKKVKLWFENFLKECLELNN